MIRKTLRIYYFVSFFLELSASFCFAIYVVFLTSRGMDLLQVNLINCFFMVSVFLLEIPTGALADSFGRKKSIVLGCFAWSLGTSVYFLSHNFWLFVLAELVMACASSFFSGAMEAWIVDSLKFYGYRGKMEKIFKIEDRFATAGVIIGGLSGAYIGSINIGFPWLVSAVFMFFCGIFCWFFLKEEYFKQKKFKLEFAPIKNVAKDSIAYGWKKKSLMCIVFFGAVVSFSCMPFNMYWAIVFSEAYSFDVSSLGWIFVGIALFSLAGSQLSVFIGSLFEQKKNAIVLTQVITVVGMIIAALTVGWFPVLAGFMFHEVGRGAIYPLKQAYLNRRIPGEKRATILSFDSMIMKVGAFIGLLVSGIIAKNCSITVAWLVAGLILAISIPIFLKIKNGENRKGERKWH